MKAAVEGCKGIPLEENTDRSGDLFGGLTISAARLCREEHKRLSCGGTQHDDVKLERRRRATTNVHQRIDHGDKAMSGCLKD